MADHNYEDYDAEDLGPTPEPSEEDFRLAEEALEHMGRPFDPTSSESFVERADAADFCAKFGADRFRLRYGLRPPSGRIEAFEETLVRLDLPLDELRRRYKQFATRPIDMEMLTDFLDAYQELLSDYGAFFQAVARASSRDADLDDLPNLHRAADSAMERLTAKFDLFSTELKTVFDFLAELQSDRSTPIHLGDYLAHTAHWLAELVFERAEQGWEECQELEDLLLGETAARIFRREWIDTRAIPLPNDLQAVVLLEQAAAKKALRERLESEAERRAANAAGGAQNAQTATPHRDAAEHSANKAPTSRGASWKDVQARLLQLYDAGEPYTSIGKLAKSLGCSNDTIKKAIDRSTGLKAWQAQANHDRKSPKAVGFNEVHADNAVQTLEADPAESVEDIEERDAILEELIRQADGDPAAAADLRSRDTEELRDLHRLLRKDPDRGDQILGRRP